MHTWEVRNGSAVSTGGGVYNTQLNNPDTSSSPHTHPSYHVHF